MGIDTIQSIQMTKGVCLLLLAAWLLCSAFGQDAPEIIPRIPADRRADTYDVYSAALARSHDPGIKRYLVQELSASCGSPQACVKLPARYHAKLNELVRDSAALTGKQFRLERRFKVSVGYEFVTADQAKQVITLMNSPAHSTDEVEIFRGATDLITLGNVYFDRNRTLAAVYTTESCGGQCGYGAWRIFTRNGKGGWEERDWASCVLLE